MSDLVFSDAERRAMERLGDALIPPAAGALSASEAGIGGPLLDQILVLVPERVPLLRQVMARAGDTPAEAALAALKRTDPVLYDGFCETVVGAYFMSPEVKRLVAYPGRVAVPARIDVTDLEDLLLPVLEQGFAPRLPPGSPDAAGGSGLMATMLAAYLPGNDTVELRDIPVPEPGIGQVRLRMKASGLCGSDIHYIYHKHVGEKGARYMGVVAGHEPCGQIESTGLGCRHFKPGDRVAVYHISGCGFCRSCRKGYQISCTDPLRAAYGWQRDGGHAEYLIADEKDLVKLPDVLTYEDGCFISCGVGTAYEGILRGEVSGSDTVLVVGLGPVGLAALMIAQGRGAKMTVGIDTQRERVATAARLGLVNHGFVAGADTLAAAREVTRGGATVTLDCSGNPRGRLLALQATHAWGRCVYIGETGEVTFKVSDDLMHQQRRIIGSWVTSLHNMDQCAEDLADWHLYPRDLITDRFTLGDAGAAYALAASGRSGKIILTIGD